MSIEDKRSEAQLWLNFRQGQKKSFSCLYENCFQKLYSYGINMGMNDIQVRDAIQEIFLKLYIKPEIITDPNSLLPFLFRCVRNYFLNMVKKESTQVGIEDYISSFTFEYTIEEHLVAEEEKESLTRQIQEIMSCLTPRQKEIIYFRFLYEMDYEEIAQILNITQQGARNMLYKAFEKIRKTYPQYLPLLTALGF